MDSTRFIEEKMTYKAYRSCKDRPNTKHLKEITVNSHNSYLSLFAVDFFFLKVQWSDKYKQFHFPKYA